MTLIASEGTRGKRRARSVPAALALAAVVAVGTAGACLDSGHLLGTSHGTGGQPATGTGGSVSTGGAPAAGGGGVTGSGGATGTGGLAGTGGAVGTGGTVATGGAVGSGGPSASGGATASGGARAGGASGMAGAGTTGGTPGSGGRASAGGAAGAVASGGAGGAAGSAGGACGGPAGTGCPAGQFCDLASNCGTVADATGVCAPYGSNVTCSDQEMPVCGCEGRTYVNDCQREAAGMLKAMDGVCPNGTVSYPSAYLSWQATGAGQGPAVTVTAPDWLLAWNDTLAFPPESAPANPSSMYPLDIYMTDDLFLRLAGINVSALPHASQAASGCQATLYFRLCKGCATNTLTYGAAGQLSPEMELIWTWFDRMTGAAATTNPRNFCGP